MGKKFREITVDDKLFGYSLKPKRDGMDVNIWDLETKQIIHREYYPESKNGYFNSTKLIFEKGITPSIVVDCIRKNLKSNL